MLPEQFLDRMQKMLGSEYEAFVESFEQEKYQALRLNALKISMNGVSARALGESSTENTVEKLAQDSMTKSEQDASQTNAFAHLTPVSWAKNGYYYEKEDTPGKHPYHEAGVYYIQEPSAMAPVTLLDPQPGEHILDLCAAPGGKSTQIAAAMNGEGLLVTNEIHPARAKILSENIERMGIRNACVTNETPQHLAQVFPEYFDRVLVDAPCSGEGMFRKNEAACEEWSLENVELCGERQDEILDCAAQMLRTGGRLVYSTCTFAPIENEGSISRFLSRHTEFSIIEIPKQELGIDGDGVSEYVEEPAPGIEKTLRLWPHRIKGEGHYAAVLTKINVVGLDENPDKAKIAECDMVTSNDESARNDEANFGGVDGEHEAQTIYTKLQPRTLTMAPGGLQKRISEKELGEFPAFAKEFLRGKLAEISHGNYMKFGDNIYLMPENMPNLKGLKVLRPGLHIGTLKKNRFEPSHALALALDPRDAVHTWNLSSKENTINAYLDGQTFPAEGEKGWYLICVDGFGIGWGKLAGGIMKNHYPKGLRKNMR